MAPQSRLECPCSRRTDPRRPRDLTEETTAQTAFYTHRGLDGRTPSIRPGGSTPATPPRSRPRGRGRLPRIGGGRARIFYRATLLDLLLIRIGVRRLSTPLL